jgi:hypothetical protein
MFAASKTDSVSGAAPVDAQFNYVTMLLHGDGTNGAQNNTFLDSSASPLTITRNGNTTQGSFSPYGSTWSNYFDGSSSIFSGSNAAFGFGTGDFTVEFWLFLSAIPASGFKYTLVDFRPTNGATPHTMYVANSSGTLYLGFYNGSADVTSSSQPVTANTWVHCAYSRASGTLKIYVNGNQAYSAANTVDYQATRNLTIGASVSIIEGATGYFSNFRITKGAGLYTTAFNPSTVPLTTTVPSGTVTLLTCQGNRFVDASNTVTLSLTSAPSVQRFNPFGTSTAYSTATIGGSGYFDGTGDYLSVNNSTAFDFGTGDFTIECYVYPTAVQDNFTMIAATDSPNLYWGFGTIGSGGMSMYGGSSGTDIYSGTASNPQLNAWSHLVWQRGSGVVSMYLNGTRVYNAAYTTDLGTTTTTMYIGESPTNYPGQYELVGYLSGFRVTKSAVYSGTTITIPTAPLPVVANTSLLCNFQNAAIYDNAMMNNLETVGNAQISTSVVKYGTGSMYFDGSGDYLQGPHTTNAEFGKGDFTVEFWAYIVSQSGTYTGVVGQWIAGGSASDNSWNISLNEYNTTNKLGISYSDGSTGTDVAFGSALTTGTWNHYAICRSGNLLFAFKDGVLLNSGGTAITATITNGTSPFRVGSVGTAGGGSDFNGYIDDLRITKGYARYTTTFTPPTLALPDSGPY